jgi:hypothetical protein
VLKRKGFRLLGGGTMKKVVMLFSLKPVKHIRNTEYMISLGTERDNHTSTQKTQILLIHKGQRNYSHKKGTGQIIRASNYTRTK